MESKSRIQDRATVERLVAQQERSGLSMREFAEANGLTTGQMYGYRQRAKQKANKASLPTFQPVMTGKQITLELSNGKAISFAKEHLAEILHELSR